MSPEVTIFRKANGILSKRISLDESGKVASDGSECRMGSGEGQRCKLDGIASLSELIANMQSDQALALGRLRSDLPDRVRVVTKANLSDADPDTIARSKEYLHFAPNEPAYMLLDHDRKGLPSDVAAKLKEAKGFWRAVVQAVPALANAARVRRLSTSAGLYHRKSGKDLPGSKGQHVYIPVTDGADIERALKCLHDRLWLAGFGFHVIGAAGQLLDRSIIDASVYGPERLVFEGAPIVVPPLAQDEDLRQPRVHAGVVVDTRTAFPDLSPDEQCQLATLKAKASTKLRGNAAEARTTWACAFASRRGLSEQEAERIATQALNHVVEGEFELKFDNPKLGTRTVADVLDDPERYIGETLADPLEGVAYGRNKAKVLLNGSSLLIHSFAHGGINYKLAGQNHDLPVIKIVDGEIARVVDEAQTALLQAQIPIFVRAGQLVEPITVEREAANSGSITESTVFAPLSKEKLSYLLNKQAARFEKFAHRGWVVTNPPAQVATTLLALKGWNFSEVTGVIGAPTIRPDGSVLSKQGYDPQTRLWLAAEFELPPIPEQPTRQEAATALRLYKELLSGFPFVNATDKAVALAAVLTAVLRGGFELTPMFLVVAHDAGTGKSYLADVIATIVTGRPCPVMSPGKSPEEMEKRLGAVLLEGGIMLSLDNLTFDLDSKECNLLCQMLTQLLVKIRILGQSAVPECEWRGILCANGNNIRVLGDLVRRTLTCNLDAKVERPEQREFAFDPIARVLSDRGAYVAAAITIARAYRAAERAATNAKPLNGYPAWSALVREPLMWLGEHDPVKSMDRAREADPARAAANELVQRWQTRIGIDKAVTVRNIIAIANEMKPDRWEVHRFPKFRELLIEHAGTAKADGIDAVKLGRWLQTQHGRVFGTLRIDLVPHKGRSNEYVLRQVEGQD